MLIVKRYCLKKKNGGLEQTYLLVKCIFWRWIHLCGPFLWEQGYTSLANKNPIDQIKQTLFSWTHLS